jgi:hypothetical protein
VRWAGIFVAAVIGAGCGENKGFTELRMLVESDLGPQDQVNILRVSPLDQLGMGIGREHPSFPLVVTLSPGGPLRAFGLNVQLLPDAAGQVILLSRNVRDLAFVEGQQRMFVLPLLARCKCQGTACPDPGDPDCDELSAPVLAPLDERTNREPDLTFSPPPLPVTP